MAALQAVALCVHSEIDRSPKVRARRLLPATTFARRLIPPDSATPVPAGADGDAIEPALESIYRNDNGPAGNITAVRGRTASRASSAGGCSYFTRTNSTGVPAIAIFTIRYGAAVVTNNVSG
jgi:hypothetical protein